jgi:hypothetical protein
VPEALLDGLGMGALLDRRGHCRVPQVATSSAVRRRIWRVSAGSRTPSQGSERSDPHQLPLAWSSAGSGRPCDAGVEAPVRCPGVPTSGPLLRRRPPREPVETFLPAVVCARVDASFDASRCGRASRGRVDGANGVPRGVRAVSIARRS